MSDKVAVAQELLLLIPGMLTSLHCSPALCDKCQSFSRAEELDVEPPKMQAYEICVQGHLDLDWADWFDGFTLAHRPEGVSVLTGVVADQTALHGTLNKIRNLGLLLISVKLIEGKEA